jgi:hypothetical protein
MTLGIPQNSELTFRFPKDFSSRNFTVCYSRFAADATIIELGMSKQKCTYTSGDAVVVSNDGTKFSVQFTNYKLMWNTNRTLIIDGTTPF